jgi:hypothetical protein
MARDVTKTPPKAGGRAGGARKVDAQAADGEAEAAKTGVRMKDLVERVTAATGGNKKGVKEIVEATLLQMGEALKKGESLNLPLFGKLRVARASTEEGGAMTLKLRQGSGKGKGEKEGLAEDDDQD